MKRTKKSLIIAPALGVLLLASVGSVSGTVAWFSSVSKFDTEISQFGVTRLDGNLACTMAAGSGTYLDGSDIKVGESSSISVQMTHASFDHTASKVYTISSEAAGGYRDVTATLLAKTVDSTHKIYWAVNWTMDFSYTFATEEKVNLYLDNSTSGSSISGKQINAETAAAATNATWLGFRMAFIGEAYVESTSTTTEDCLVENKVWADQQTTTNCKYIHSTGTNTYAVTPYNQSSATDLIASDTAADKYTEGQAQAKGGVYYLGQFNNAEDTAHIKFTCWAWFEGTDPNVADNKELNRVIASLKFYTRESSD